jgi:hypothetical protein
MFSDLNASVTPDYDSCIALGPPAPCCCKGNLTVLRRILYLDLAKGNPNLIYKWDWLMYNT